MRRGRAGLSVPYRFQKSAQDLISSSSRRLVQVNIDDKSILALKIEFYC